MGNRNIKFIKLLRCIATIMVFWWHLGVIFWYANQSLSEAFRVEFFGSTDSLHPFYRNAIETCFDYRIDFGMFGVAVFFLLTGFLTAHTIGNNQQTFKTSLLFLVKKVLRLWPVYVCGFSVTFLCLQLYRGEIIYGIKDYFIQISLFGDLIGKSSIDGISWTLEAQLKFYLVCFAILAINKWHAKFSKILIIGGMTLFRLLFVIYEENILMMSWGGHRIGSVLIENIIYIIYMFLGVLLNDLYEKRIDKRTFFVQITAALIAFFICVFSGQALEVALKCCVNYGAAALLFFVCYWFRDRINTGRFVNFLDERSFAVYLLHGVNGYILLSCMQRCGLNFLLSMSITVLVMVIASSVFYRYVEKNIAKCNHVMLKKIKSLLGLEQGS